MFFCILMISEYTHQLKKKKKATRRFVSQNAMSACYWKHTCFFYLAFRQNKNELYDCTLLCVKFDSMSMLLHTPFETITCS